MALNIYCVIVNPKAKPIPAEKASLTMDLVKLIANK